MTLKQWLVRGFVVCFFLAGSTALLAQSSAQKTLDRFKSMVGTWQGKSPTGGTS